MGAAERGEPHHAGVILGRRLEGSGEGVPDGRLVGRPSGHDGDAVVDALPLVAGGEEQLITPERAAQVEAELGAGVVWNREGGGVGGPTLPLDQIERLEGIALAVAEDRAVELVGAALGHGADHERRAARVLGIVGVQVDAELAHRLLGQGRARLRDPHQVAVEEALPLSPVQVKVPETQVRQRTGGGERPAGRGRKGLHPRHDGSQVDRVARVEGQVEDLGAYDRGRHVPALHLERRLALMRDLDPLDGHGGLLKREVERSGSMSRSSAR